MIARFLTSLSAFERWTTSAAFLLMAIIMFADVVARELTGSGIIWARQAAVFANVVVVMIGMGIASSQAEHLRPRFADRWLPASWEPFLRRLEHLFMAAFCGAFVWIAATVVTETFELGERATVLRSVPVWTIQIVLPIAFTLAAVRHLLYGVFLELAPRRSHLIAAEQAAAQAATEATESAEGDSK